MKYKISSVERKVGFFLVISFVTIVAVVASFVAQSHLFKKTISYTILVETVNQLQKGTKIQVRGLNIGSVTDINVADAGEFKVHFEVEEKYRGFLKKGSSVHFKNPLIVGEKVLEVIIGEGPSLLEEGAVLEVNEGEDLVKKIGDINWQKVNSILEKLDSVMGNTDILMKALSKDLPKTTARGPKIAADAEQAVKDLNLLIKELTALQPDIKKAVGNIPQITEKTDKAIAEAIIVLRAAQKTWLLKSNVKEAKKDLASESK
jgi:ABC-type transporter Mla subunit MlaD